MKTMQLLCAAKWKLSLLLVAWCCDTFARSQSCDRVRTTIETLEGQQPTSAVVYDQLGKRNARALTDVKPRRVRTYIYIAMSLHILGYVFIHTCLLCYHMLWVLSNRAFCALRMRAELVTSSFTTCQLQSTCCSTAAEDVLRSDVASGYQTSLNTLLQSNVPQCIGNTLNSEKYKSYLYA